MAIRPLSPGLTITSNDVTAALTPQAVADKLGDNFAEGDLLKVSGTNIVTALPTDIRAEWSEGLSAGAVYVKDSTQNSLIPSGMTVTTEEVRVNKTINAKKIKAAEKTIEIGPGVSIGGSGGEIIIHDSTYDPERHYYMPRKHIGISDNTGTAGAYTLGRIVGTFSEIVGQPLDALLSTDPSAATPNNTDPNKIQFITTITGTTDFLSKKYFFKSPSVTTGIRMIVRLNSSTGPIVFESEPTFTWEEGTGITSLVWDGINANTRTVLDLQENPQLFRVGQTIHVSIEKFGGQVVLYGGLVGGHFIPYFSRERADVTLDPVVATGIETVTTNYVMPENYWYDTIFADATSGPIQITLPSAVQTASNLANGVPINVIKIDSTNNAVTVVPFSGQTLNKTVALEKKDQYVEIWSNGTNPVAFIPSTEQKIESSTGFLIDGGTSTGLQQTTFDGGNAFSTFDFTVDPKGSDNTTRFFVRTV